MKRRMLLKLLFYLDSFFWWIGVCPVCPPITKYNFTRNGTAVCPNCGKRVHR